MNLWQARIGLEIHAQLLTQSKAFCSCLAQHFGDPANTHICPVCSGQPGALPVLNRRTVELGVKAALALDAKLSADSRFDRKTYDYPDLPKGYQITQYHHPLARDGFLSIRLHGRKKHIAIERIHIEEDTGKLVHLEVNGQPVTLLDLNRSGVALIEIVTRPQITSPLEASVMMEMLRDLLRWLGVCSGEMEKGAMRCDANLSIRNQASGMVSQIVEIKNLNSFRYLNDALSFEYDRLVNMMESQHRENLNFSQTRGWDEKQKETYFLRRKLPDSYRYLPEPDLPPLRLDPSWITHMQENLPELPQVRQSRLSQAYGLSDSQSQMLVYRESLLAFFEEAAHTFRHHEQLVHWVFDLILPLLNHKGVDIDQTHLKCEDLMNLLQQINDGRLTEHLARSLLSDLMDMDMGVQDLLVQKGVEHISSISQVEVLVDQVIAQHPQVVTDFREGKDQVAHYLIGLVMKASRGQASPIDVRDVVEKRLKEG